MDYKGIGDIVVIEDNADDSLLLIHQLKRALIDDHVTVIANGYAARNFLLEVTKPPLVIFLDLNLPGLSGVELLRHIRSVRRLQTVPVIVMTGSSDPRKWKECTDLGVTAILEKPLSLSTFIKTVTHLFPLVTA